MYSRILVPLDGSKLSECALEHVRHIVQGSPTPEVLLITVHQETGANLLEYYKELMRKYGKVLFVGCHPMYERKADVKMLEGPNIVIHNMLDCLAADVIKWANSGDNNVKV